MEFIPLLLSFFSLSIVSMDLALAIVLYRKERQRWTAWFVVLLASLLGLSFLFTLDQFSTVFFSGVSRFVLHVIWEVFFIADSSFLLVMICFFTNWIIARPMGFYEKILAYLFGAGYLVGAILKQIYQNPLFERIEIIFALMSISYGVAVMLSSHQQIENKRVRIVTLTISIVSLSSAPLLIASCIWPNVSSLMIPIVALAYFIAFLVFIYMAISKDPVVVESQEKKDMLTMDDVAKFGITGRELEVIRLITQGLTNKEIASYLSISVNTVNNHIANIFSKTNVRSRIDLLNLLQKASW